MRLEKYKIFIISSLAIAAAAIALFQNARINPDSGGTFQKIEPELPKPQSASEIQQKVLSFKPVNFTVPFTPQAPTGNWDELHNEACEEAGVIMAKEYFYGNTEAIIPASLVESQLQKLTQWQQHNLGHYLDSTSAEIALMAEANYGLKTQLIENFSIDDVKLALSQDKLVLVSANGRLLKNPYYKPPGPLHHLLLIKGFDENGNFITNDSGTKRGAGYLYSFNALYDAAGDWDPAKNTVDTNKKIAIVVWRE